MSEEENNSVRKPRTKSGYRMGGHTSEICKVKFRKEQWEQLAAAAGFREHSLARSVLRSAYSQYLTTRLALQHYPYAREVAGSLKKSKAYIDQVVSRFAALQKDQAFEQAEIPEGNVFGLDVEWGIYSIDTTDRVALTELGHHARKAYEATCIALSALEDAEASYRELSQRASERSTFLGEHLKPIGGKIKRDEYYEPEIILLTYLAGEMANRGLSLKNRSTSSTSEKWRGYPYPKAASALLNFAIAELSSHKQVNEAECPPAYFANYLINVSPTTFTRISDIGKKRATATRAQA